MPMSGKVFCGKCKFLYWVWGDPPKCKYNENKFYFNDWYGKYTEGKKPSELNKNNDCKWFKKGNIR
jgi:hypothetical protein